VTRRLKSTPNKRYQKWIGKEIEVDGLTGKFKLKVIADPQVDMKFGTGVVKVTPAHDFNDFDVWLKHKDEIPGPKQVIGFDGRLNQLTGKYAGLKIAAARIAIVTDLKQKGLLEKVDHNYTHAVGVCYRCGTVIEPLPLKQFFIKVKPLVKPVLAALKAKKIVIFGAGHDKILKHWLTHLEDWNISRQIVWGIRIPVWYKKAADKSEYIVAKTSPGKDYVQETDTFDTWFSSGQWPVVTLMTGKKGDFDRFYPTDVMETGYDILPIWVLRMLLLGIYRTGQVPFRKIFLHGLVRDEKGQKMSKSKGNVVDPIEVINRYGADALRMSLVMSTTAGRDSATGEGKIRGMRNLTNKIWNAARYVLLSRDSVPEKIQPGDKKFLSELDAAATTITKQLDNLKIGLAAETVYDKFWHWFCDKKIEAAKKGEISYPALLSGLRTFLKLLHPFTPFVTEAVWQQLPETKEKLLILSRWPRA